jgi:hypothetical protein
MMKSLYISFEQEMVLREHPLLQTWAKGETPTDDQYHHGYVVVSPTSYGNESEGWVPALIGPFHDSRAQKVTEEVEALLKSLGHTVYTTDTAPGQWVMGGLYVPNEGE